MNVQGWGRRSLYYVVGYLAPSGLALVIAPEPAMRLIGSTGDYGDVMPRVVGVLLLGGGGLVAQIIRHRAQVLYATTLGVCLLGVAACVALYVDSQDPMFLVMVVIVGVGVFLTSLGLAVDHRRLTRSQPSASSDAARTDQTGLAETSRETDRERRRQRRVLLGGSVTVTTASGQAVEASVVDVSLLGWRFTTDACLSVGQSVSAHLQFPTGRSHQVEGTIRSISEGPPYQYGVGFSSETVERLIKEAFKPS